jgi:hypothetical protein
MDLGDNFSLAQLASHWIGCPVSDILEIVFDQEAS